MIANIARRIGRYVALPVVSAGIIGGAALGLAGMANAATPSYNPEPRPGIVAVPQTKAKPAAEAPRRVVAPASPVATRSVDCVAVHSALRITTAQPRRDQVPVHHRTVWRAICLISARHGRTTPTPEPKPSPAHEDTNAVTITHRFRRYIALPAVSAGIIGGAPLGMAGMANASTYPSQDPTQRTGFEMQAVRRSWISSPAGAHDGCRRSDPYPLAIKPPTAWRCAVRSGMEMVISVPGDVERTSNCPPDASTLARIDAIPI